MVRPNDKRCGDQAVVQECLCEYKNDLFPLMIDSLLWQNYFFCDNRIDVVLQVFPIMIELLLSLNLSRNELSNHLFFISRFTKST